MPENNKPNVYVYHDFVKFLNDWLVFLRKTRSDFSLRNLAKQSTIALGYMNMILKRERSMSEKAFLKIVSNLHLNSDEEKYLNLLRIVDQTEDSNARLQAVSEMMKIKKYKFNNQKENRTYEYLTKWYFVAVYEMFNLDNFECDAKWIRTKLRKKLSLAEIEQAIDFLKANNFVKQNPNGTWSQSNAHLDCTEGIFKVSLAEFHKQMLELAHESIYAAKASERFIMGQTMTISKSDFEKIKQIIQNSVASINEVNSGAASKTEVYHIEIAAFPLSESNKESVK